MMSDGLLLLLQMITSPIGCFNLVDWGFNLGFRSGEMSKGLSLRFDILASIS
jgi:hypothetical protein